MGKNKVMHSNSNIIQKVSLFKQFAHFVSKVLFAIFISLFVSLSLCTCFELFHALLFSYKVTDPLR